MAKLINNPEDLKRLQEQYKADMDLRGALKDIRITVHMGTCGIAAGARDILMELADQLAKSGAEKVMLTQSGCVGMCQQEPMMTLKDAAGKEFVYGKLDKQKVREIVRQHVLGGTALTPFIINTKQGTLVKGESQ